MRRSLREREPHTRRNFAWACSTDQIPRDNQRSCARPGEADGREVTDRVQGPEDLIGSPGLNAGQILAAVDLVNHHLEIERVAGGGVARLRTVTEDAQLYVLARSAMRREGSRTVGSAGPLA